MKKLKDKIDWKRLISLPKWQREIEMKKIAKEQINLKGDNND